MDKISILTPFRNAEKYIAETAQSIFRQSHTNWEWILINDHSEQNELECLKDFLLDERVKVIRNEGKGITDALVAGFKIATGDFVTRMDADDIMPNNKLTLFLGYLQNFEAKIVTGYVQYFSEEGEISSGYRKYEAWLNDRVSNRDFYDEIYRECTLASGNWMMRSTDLSACGGFAGLNYPEDYDLLFRWYEHGLKLEGIEEITHLWREHPDRTSKNSEDYGQKKFFELKIDRFVRHDRKMIPLILSGTGAKGNLTAKKLLSLNVDFEWVSIEPEKFRSGIYGQRILGVDEVKGLGKIQVLNASVANRNAIKALYNEHNEVVQVIDL